VIRGCKHGAKLAKAALYSGSHQFYWARLMTLVEPLSEDLVTILTEYNAMKGIVVSQVPFSAQDIRDNVELIIPEGECVDFKVFHRVCQAFTEVDYNGLPCVGIDFNKFIKYLMAHPCVLSVDEFSRFLRFVKAEKLVDWENEDDY
jgi:hypothetical protein